LLNVNLIEDDAAEAVEPAVELSPSRRTLGSLIEQRNAANAEADKARASIRRLQAMQGREAPLVAQLAQLDAQDAEHMRRWSADAGDAAPPQPDFTKRAAIVRAIEEAVATAESAARAVPGFEADVTRATVAANAIGHRIAAEISAIISEEVAPGYAQIIALKADLSERLARCESGREQALRLMESIPMTTRMEIMASRQQQSGDLDKLRLAAHSPPAPSTADSLATWAAFARNLSASGDAPAPVVEG
jgi:hypothetical protein